jgi:hypothetical protein
MTSVSSVVLMFLKIGVESIGIVALLMLLYAVFASLTGKRTRKSASR